MRSDDRNLNGVRLSVSYDGTDFAGWQRQPAQRTVQSVLERAVQTMSGEPTRVRGASRTDAGVHALAQVAAFDCARVIPREGILRGLNSELPHDVAVREVTRCPPGYDPRYDAAHKTYRYTVRLGMVRDPLSRRYAWHLPPGSVRPGPPIAARGDAPEEWLDLGAMRDTARGLLGTHDFRAFRASNDARNNTMRTVTEITVGDATDERGPAVCIEVSGNAFLKNMVRILVGTLVEVGRERRTPADVVALLGPEGKREQAGPTAPAQGLVLLRIVLGRSNGALLRGGG